jgi:hypothetical protein
MDGPLSALAQMSGGDLRRLLHGFFSFLHRRTDFYVVHPSEPKEGEGEGDNSSQQQQRYSMGFREGDAEKLLLAAFRQFPLRRMPSRPPPPAPSSAPAEARQQQPPSPQASTQSPTSSAAHRAAPAASSEGGGGAVAATAKPGAKAEAGGKSRGHGPAVRHTDEGLQVPVGNGGWAPGYTWTQTIDECTVLVGPLPPELSRARNWDVRITSTSLSVRRKTHGQPSDAASSGDTGGEGSGEDFSVAGTLAERVVPSESTWTIEAPTGQGAGGSVLIVVLYKAVKTWWKSVLAGDPEIDTAQVDSRRHIGEYDPETQGQLRKIMFDESQLRRGLPTSDELSGKATAQLPPGLPASLPDLPPGVEYIDRTTLEENAGKKAGEPT